MDTLAQLDFNSMPFDNLVALNQKAQAAIDARRAQVSADFRTETLERAKRLGIDLTELLTKQTRTKKPSVVRYRDPANPENVWSGKGVPPKWLKEKIAVGEDRESYKAA